LVLVDTSVWIEIFKKPPGLDLNALVEIDEVVTCLPVVQEVLQGFRDERAFQIAREAIRSFPIVEAPMTEPLFLEAVALYRTARRRGLTIRSSVDCLIAACALRHDLEILHDDRDFAALSEVSALKQRAR
jgi:predicted nucleic acid-binding protein